MKIISKLNTKIFADGADLDGILQLSKEPFIKGFTTNPSLMRQSGISDYEGYAREVLRHVHSVPVSFEVFADDLETMEKQARKIADWGPNVNVKIPITTTTGEFCGPIIERLSKDGICVNVTAIMTIHQTQAVANCLDRETPAIISVFAGRIADTGRDPVPIMSECLKILNEHPNAELLWASPRELLNIFQASDIACPIITVGHNLLSKIDLIGKDLTEFSRETVSMFFNDAKESGYRIG